MNIIDLSLKRGIIYISDINNYHIANADEKFFCTSIPDVLCPEGTLHMNLLAPSVKLTTQKLKWIENDVFEKKYPMFKYLYMEEIYKNEDMLSGLIALRRIIAKGKSIVLFDNCGLGSLCHLNILSEVLVNRGYRVYKL